MQKCILCGGKVNFFSKKAKEGYVCKECVYLLPDIDLSESRTDYLKPLVMKNAEKRDIFETTESYGCLYIDSVHNMFCISHKHDGDTPLEYGNIFYIYELAEVGLYCSDVRNIGINRNNVVCNVKLKILTKKDETDYVVSKEYLVAGNEICTYKSVGNRKFECKEPPKLTMFRNMFNQMIENEMFGTLRKLQNIYELRKKLQEETALIEKEI